MDDFCRQITGNFSGVRDDRVEVDLEVKEAYCWRGGVTVVGECIATNCLADAVRFSLGDLDVADKVGIGNVFV